MKGGGIRVGFLKKLEEALSTMQGIERTGVMNGVTLIEIQKEIGIMSQELANFQEAFNKLINDVQAAIADIKSINEQIAAAAGDTATIQTLTDQANATASALEAALPQLAAPAAEPASAA